MKKILLSVLCIFLISCGISCVCATNDMGNATMNHDFSQNDTQPDVDNTTAVTLQNSTSCQKTENITEDGNNTVQSNETSTNGTCNNTPKFNIVGPKNITHVNIPGPKGSNFGGLFTLQEKLVWTCSNYLVNHPDLTIGEIINYLGKSYWYLAPKVISEAYDIALNKTDGKMLYPDGLTEFDIEKYMTEYDYLLYPDE